MRATQEPIYMLTHHKCASSWLSDYLKSYCSRNLLNMFASHFSEPEIDVNNDVVLLRNASYRYVQGKVAKGIHVIRNPLNIVVSAYYSHRNTHPLEGWPELEAQRAVLRSVNEPEGMLLTIAFLEREEFYSGAVGPLYALRHWDFSDERFSTLRMEDLVDDLGQLTDSLLGSGSVPREMPDSRAFTFEAITGRQVGKVDMTSHYRSGDVEQWRQYLPQSAQAYLFAHFEPLLKRFYPETLDHVEHS